MKTFTKELFILTILFAFCACDAQITLKKVLVFDKSGLPPGEPTIPADSMMAQLSRANNFNIAISVDSTLFNDDSLKLYQVIVFNNVGRNVLASSQQDAFISYIENGGGYVGFHASATGHEQWPWYSDSFVGGDDLPGTAKGNSVVYADTVVRAGHQLGAEHPIMKGIPKVLPQYGEWYDWNHNPADDSAITVLQWYTTAGLFSNVPSVLPETWCREYGTGQNKGRMFYTELSHQDSVFGSTWYRTMILNALKWAAHDEGTPVTKNSEPVFANRSLPERSFISIGRKNQPGSYSLNGRVMPYRSSSQIIVRKQ